MMKILFPALLLVSFAGSGIRAQTVSGGETSGSDSSPAPAEKKKAAADQAPQGPTVIDSNNMDYDGKTRIAIFTGENYGVFVKDPSFTVYCDKLTAFMRKAAGPALPGAKPTATPTPTPTPAAKGKGADPAAAKASGLQRAIAEGNPDYPVVIVQDKPGVNGAAPVHNVGIALNADYNADTGDVKLTGWPRVSQGINTQIATADYTVMTMNKDGHTMKTEGPSRTVIQQQDQPKTTGTDSQSSDQSPSLSPQ
jgi:lipopolysaccharide export system protein LptA